MSGAGVSRHHTVLMIGARPSHRGADPSQSGKTRDDNSSARRRSSDAWTPRAATGGGALTGAFAGAVFGPVGLVGGAPAGGTIQARAAEQLDGELFAEVRDSVPEGGSALMLVAERRQIDAMIDALRATQARVAIRRTLFDDAMAALEFRSRRGAARVVRSEP